MELDNKSINQLFIRKLQTPEGLQKLAQEGAGFIRTQLREAAFSRKIVNPTYVTQADCQRSTEHDQPVKIVDIEPDSGATILTFRGQPEARYVHGNRAEVNFFKIASDKFQKQIIEFMTYEYNVTEVIDRNSVKDIQFQEDSRFITITDAAIANSGNNVTSGVLASGAIPKVAFKNLFDILDGNQLKSDVILMDATMFNRLPLYPAAVAGDGFSSETMVNGYTYGKIFNRRLVVSNKSSLLTDKIYCFTSQEYLGVFYILDDLTFWIDKNVDVVTWEAYEYIAQAIINNAACARLDIDTSTIVT